MSGGTLTANSNIGTSAEEKLAARDVQAMKLFEQAVEKEGHGLMSEAIEYYRKAFKINEQIDLLYRKHKVPQNVEKLKNDRGKNSAVKLDEEKIKKINVDDLLDSFEGLNISVVEDLKVEELEGDDSDTENIDGDDQQRSNEENVAVESSPLLRLPNDTWVSIFEILLITSPESWFNYSITCRKNAFLGLRSSILWKRLCTMIYPNQHYEENQLFLVNRTLGDDINENNLPIPRDPHLIVPQYGNSWKRMLNDRPFLKMLGCYISVVNYYSEGGVGFSSSWNNPIRIITYYRYLRFYPDGTCIKLLSNLEPNVVVPHLSRKDLNALGNDNTSPKEGRRIYSGKWTINSEGEVHVIISDGSVSIYNFHYHFQIKSSGPAFRHNKLIWKRYFTVKKIRDEADWEDEESDFSLKNEKPFLFSRVRRYNVDN
ncbi:F-box protein Hrt3p [[Candida] anglica]|uniref:F-box protein Hrt3p n=1 Tax=[Candida] anglica TaxID=148631 RepID=A0ABP0EB13_9ASCO